MDRTPSDSLTPEEAKSRLREAAGRIGIGAWVRRHPYEALAAAVVCGLLMGDRGRGAAALREEILPLLLRVWR